MILVILMMFLIFIHYFVSVYCLMIAFCLLFFIYFYISLCLLSCLLFISYAFYSYLFYVFFYCIPYFSVDEDRLEKERAAVLSEASMVNKMEYRVECQVLSALHSENRISTRFPIGNFIFNWFYFTDFILFLLLH